MARAASEAWERIASPDDPQNYVWAWFKPATVPQGLLLRIPDEVYRTRPQIALRWTVRRLVQLAGFDPACVSMWRLYGVVCYGMNGANPVFDAPIPAPIAGADPNIVVCIETGQTIMAARPMPPIMPAAAPIPVRLSANPPSQFHVNGAAISPTGAAANAVVIDPTLLELYERIDSDWLATIELERDQSRLRKQLLDLMGRLKSLNRDLTPLERLHANSQEKKEWTEARRGLRDAATRVWKCVKAVDIGETSSAGQRLWFEETHKNMIVPRRSFEGLQQAARAFESRRKAVQTLHGEMNNAYSVGSLDGERRAQQVLARITQRVREASNRKNFLGLMLDR
jgi:hypothetical protein